MSPLFYISLFILFIALIRFFVTLLNFLTRPVLPYGEINGKPLVSVLVPARNEEQNIGRLLSGLVQQTYTNFEVMVYNDQSTDNTEQVVNRFINEDSRIELIQGKGPEEGWLGKNYGCHQLAQSAKGDFFLYLDADVMVSPHLIENAVAYMQRKRLVLLSMFPRQELKTFGELLVIPSMNWILLSMLFLRLVRWSRRRSLAAANGQMMMFEAANYRDKQWHSRVKSSPVEDITISRMIKREKLRMATLLGTDDISCRMYGSYDEAITGFTKNVTAFFGGSIIVTLFFALMGTVGPFIIILGLPFPLAFLYFFSLVSARMLVAKLSEQSGLFNVILWPVQHIAFLHLVISAVKHRRRKRLQWKGRNI
jgi:glycosyltransferase involved in cell wall biosynthesis